MNVSNKIEELLKSRKEIKNILVDSDLDDTRTDSVWYGGRLISFDYKAKNRKNYHVAFAAIGDVSIATFLPNGTEFEASDESNGGWVGAELIDVGIDSDEKLSEQQDKAEFVWWNNNWYELNVWSSDGDFLTDGCDIVDDFITMFGTEQSLQKTIEYIEEIIEWEE